MMFDKKTFSRAIHILQRGGFDTENKEVFLKQLTAYVVQKEYGFGEYERCWGVKCADCIIEFYGNDIVRVGKGIGTKEGLQELQNNKSAEAKKNIETSIAAIEARRKYYRDYNAKNREKRKQWNKNHWEKVAKSSKENKADEDGNNKNSTVKSVPFQSITDASQTTGLSAFYLRNGIKNGTVPFIKTGNKYLVNVPLLLKQLNAL